MGWRPSRCWGSLAAPSSRGPTARAGPPADSSAARGPVAGTVAQGVLARREEKIQRIRREKKNQPKTSLNCSKGTLFVQTPARSQSAAFWWSSIGKVFIPHWLWGEWKKK